MKVSTTFCLIGLCPMWKQPWVITNVVNRQERSTVDQIFTLRQILEKCSEHGKDTHHLFIDFKAAYDNIDRRRLYPAMEELNIPQN